MTDNNEELNVDRHVEDSPEQEGMSRRKFIGATTLAGGAGVAATTLKASMFSELAQAKTAEKMAANAHVEPGELDEYYGFWSGGHSVEVRILGLPSMRELMRIPVFAHESATG